MDENLEGLVKAIHQLESELKEAEPGSKEEQAIVRSLTMLYKAQQDLNEKDIEWDEKITRREFEEVKFNFEKEKFEFEKQKYSDEKAQNEIESHRRWYTRLGEFSVEGLKILLPLAFYGTWLAMGFKFEETGSFTSTTFRGLFNKFKPTQV